MENYKDIEEKVYNLKWLKKLIMKDFNVIFDEEDLKNISISFIEFWKEMDKSCKIWFEQYKFPSPFSDPINRTIFVKLYLAELVLKTKQENKKKRGTLSLEEAKEKKENFENLVAKAGKTTLQPQITKKGDIKLIQKDEIFRPAQRSVSYNFNLLEDQMIKILLGKETIPKNNEKSSQEQPEDLFKWVLKLTSKNKKALSMFIYKLFTENDFCKELETIIRENFGLKNSENLKMSLAEFNEILLSKSKLKELISSLKELKHPIFQDPKTGTIFIDPIKTALILPYIVGKWGIEANYKNWLKEIKFIKKYKSSTAWDFIHRKVKKGIVPLWYFYAVPPTEKRIRVLNYLKRPLNTYPNQEDLIKILYDERVSSEFVNEITQKIEKILQNYKKEDLPFLYFLLSAEHNSTAYFKNICLLAGIYKN